MGCDLGILALVAAVVSRRNLWLKMTFSVAAALMFPGRNPPPPPAEPLQLRSLDDEYLCRCCRYSELRSGAA